MWMWIIPLAILLISLGVVGFVLLRHLAHIAVLNVETIKEERAKRLKERIILDRFDRFSSEKLGGIKKAIIAGAQAVSKAARRLVQRLYKLEQHYQHLKSPVATSSDPQAVKRLLEQAASLLRQDEFIPAEKLYIEVIGHHPKNVEAYEGLGNLYFKNRQYDQAHETLSFALRLQPDNASVLMSLGQLATSQGHGMEALARLRQAVGLRPKNPKYIDAYIEAALVEKNKEDARRGIKLLKEVNAENQKLKEFETRLAEIV